MRRSLLFATLLLPGPVFAQDVPPAPAGLKPEAFPAAFVLDDRGVEVRGRLFRIDDRSVVLLVDGRRREFDLAHVTKVTRRGDSLKNGAIAGAVVGVAMGLLAGGISDCRTDSGYGSCGAGQRIGFAVGSTAIYTAIGVGIDALIQGRTVIYQAPPRSGGVSFSLRW